MSQIDEWSPLADMLANLIGKYAAQLDLDSLPDPLPYTEESSEKDRKKDLQAA